MKMNISDIMLERYNLEELPPDQMNIVKNALSEDSSVKARLDALITSDAEILSDYPAPFVLGRIREGVKIAADKKAVSKHKGLSRRKIFGITFSAVGSLSAVAALFIFIPSATTLNTNPVAVDSIAVQEKKIGNTTDVIRTKGKESALYLYKKTGKEPEELLQNSTVLKGEVVQVAFQTRLPYAVIFSIDGRGGVTLHYPLDEAGSPAVERGKKIFLPSAYTLDDAPQFERFFLVTSEVGINAGFVMSKAHEFAKERSASMTGEFNIAGANAESVIIKKE
jgi:hypothetical protein